MPFAPFIAAVLGSAQIVVSKYILTKRRVNSDAFTFIVFAFIAVSSLFLFPFFFELKSSFWGHPTLLLFVICCALACIHNSLFFYAEKREKLDVLEPYILMTNLISIVVAALFFADERNIYPLIAAFVASFVLIAASVRKRHLYISRYCAMTLIASLLQALEIGLTKLVLLSLSPFSMYGLRAFVVVLFLLPFFYSRAVCVSRKHYSSLYFVAILNIGYFVAFYYGITSVGIVKTSLIFMLHPIIVYSCDYFWLGEKIHKRNVVASFVVGLCVVVANIF